MQKKLYFFKKVIDICSKECIMKIVKNICPKQNHKRSDEICKDVNAAQKATVADKAAVKAKARASAATTAPARNKTLG